MPAENVVTIKPPDKKGLLKTLLAEYGHSLTRTEGEKDHRAAIAERAENECAALKQHFKKLAMAQHKDQMKLTRDDLEAQIDLFDQALGE